MKLIKWVVSLIYDSCFEQSVVKGVNKTEDVFSWVAATKNNWLAHRVFLFILVSM